MSLIVRENVLWRCRTVLEKFDGNDLARPPRDVEVADGNLLVAGGANALFHRLVGGTSVDAFSEANAHLGVGDSTTAAAIAQTDLQASVNKSRKPMDDGYPTHTDGTSAVSPLVFRAVWEDADATFVWDEFGVFNAASGGRMLNRKVQSFNGGEPKPSSQSWRLTVTVSVPS